MDLNHLRLLAGVNENLSVEGYQIFLEAEKIKKGAFHKWLGKSEDEPITKADIDRGLASEDAHVRKMAQFASNMREAVVEPIELDNILEGFGPEELSAQDKQLQLSTDKLFYTVHEMLTKAWPNLDNSTRTQYNSNLSSLRNTFQTTQNPKDYISIQSNLTRILDDLEQGSNADNMTPSNGNIASSKPIGEAEIVKVETLDKEPNDTDQMEFDKERKGIDTIEDIKVKVPAEVKSSITKRLEELKTSIEVYDQKGYDDKSVKQNAVDALEKLRDHLNTGNQESYQQAQVFYGTLMSPIQDMLPARLVRFLHSGH